MTPDDHQRLTDALLPAVIAAGRLELGFFRDGCLVETKADRSPVTEADVRAEAILLAALADILPGVAVVSEEAFCNGSRPALTDPFVLVDPLDGTKQFVAGRKEWTINVAVVAGGRPAYGLIFAPALSDLFVTSGPASALRAVCDVSAVTPASHETRFAELSPEAIGTRDAAAIARTGITALLSRSRDTAQAETLLAGLHIGARMRLGSSYKFCLIAAGEGDLYPQFGDTSEWDTAAGEAILIAAGGAVASLAGAPLTYGHAEREFRNPPFIASAIGREDLPAARQGEPAA